MSTGIALQWAQITTTVQLYMEYTITPAALKSLTTKHRVIDCRFSLADHNAGQQQYAQAHIPGAYHLDMETDLSGDKAIHGGRHPLPAAQNFVQAMQRCAIDNETWVIAYDDQRLAGAARLWWLLRYFGHARVLVLSGGFAAWQAAGYEVEHQPPSHEQTEFIATANPSMVVNIDAIKTLNHQQYALIDSREPPRYNGESEPIDSACGHIPGAINAPWQRVTTDDGFVQPRKVHQELWRDIPPRTPVVYCGSGVTACVNLFSLEIAGIDNAQLYAGSFSDWCSYADNPIATV